MSDALDGIREQLRRMQENNREMLRRYTELESMNVHYMFLIGGLMGILAREKIKLTEQDNELFGKIIETFYKQNPEKKNEPGPQ